MTGTPVCTPEIVDIYRIRLDGNEADVLACSQWLSDEEKQRAAKFLSASKTREFTITRGTLKQILAYTLGEDLSRIVIANQPQGKPYLQCNGRHPRLQFSVSHSQDLAMIAITLDREIGIDVEKVRSDIDHQLLARRFFSAAEYLALQDCSEQIQLQAFFATWTRKEAIVKANGKGIALGLKQFDVSVNPDQPPRLLATRWDQQDIPGWTLMNVDAGPGYFASVAISGGPAQIRYCAIPG